MKRHFCPSCGIEIIPKNKNNIYMMIKNKTCCVKCGYIKRKINNEEYYKSEEFKRKMSDVTSGKNNGMFGKSVYSVWVEKYGVEEADKRMESAKRKWRLSSSGENNPMYGKPAPEGCGAGWSGWYKGYFFRSLHELAFLIKTPIDTIISAEGKQYAIKYIIDGKERNYFADYIINNNTMVEIKPIRLQKVKSNMIKKRYAEEYCKKMGMEYIVVDYGIVGLEVIKEEIDKGNLKLTNRTKAKFDEYIKSINTGR